MYGPDHIPSGALQPAQEQLRREPLVLVLDGLDEVERPSRPPMQTWWPGRPQQEWLGRGGDCHIIGGRGGLQCATRPPPPKKHPQVSFLFPSWNVKNAAVG